MVSRILKKAKIFTVETGKIEVRKKKVSNKTRATVEIRRLSVNYASMAKCITGRLAIARKTYPKLILTHEEQEVNENLKWSKFIRKKAELVADLILFPPSLLLGY